MHYNFNIYRGRKMFNLNFSARTDEQANRRRYGFGS